METSGAIGGGLDGSFKPLLPIYFVFMAIWVLSSIYWTLNTCRNGHFQPNKLQWMLASVPWIKALQLSLSFLFWYLYFYSNLCSIWVSFGVYIMGIVFQTCAFVSFFLISHGYCITCHRLSLFERRTIAVRACVFYMTLVGYRASVPYFSGFFILNYIVVFYVIFNHTSRNLSVLRNQLIFIENEDVHAMHDAVYTKYVMFKKFQGAMHIVAVLELAVFISMNNILESYWIRLFIREWAQFFIFMYIGWNLKCRELAPRFSLMPTWSSTREMNLPPIYRIEMDAETFEGFRSHEWHIGIPTLPPKGNSKDSVVVVLHTPYRSALDT